MQLNSIERFDFLPVQTHTGFNCRKKILEMEDGRQWDYGTISHRRTEESYRKYFARYTIAGDALRHL